MRRTRLRSRSITGLVLLLASGTPAALDVRLQVTETDQVARTPAIVTTGVPFAKGALKDVSKLTVQAAGKALPAQFLPLSPWEDGSVRWALMDVQAAVPAGGNVELAVSDGGGNPPPAAPVKVEDGPTTVKVSSGPLQFVISRTQFNLFESLKVDGKELVTAAGKGLVVYKEGGGEVTAGAPAEVRIEQAGPLRAIVCARGTFPGVHNELLGYTVRITAYAGQRFVKVHVWFENRGAMGYHYRTGFDQVPSPNMEWFPFDGMAVELGLGLGDGVTAACEGIETSDPLKVVQVCRKSRSGAVRPPLYTWNDFEYAITGAGKDLKKGDRTEGVVALKGRAGTVTAAVRHFWQNYDKAIEADGATLKLWLWPVEGRWPRDVPPGVYWDVNLAKLIPSRHYWLPGAVRKGHEFILDFSGRDPKETSAELSAPLLALASARYYAGTAAAPGLFAPPEVRTASKTCNFKLDAWMRMTRSIVDPEQPGSLIKAQQQSAPDIYFHGWMDYGDICMPAIGPVSLHYDWTWIMLVNGLRTGDRRFLALAVPMARHRIDVDQLWSDRDPPQCRGLQRGTRNIALFHCQRLWTPPTVMENWLAGVVLYYLFTGEPQALECCTRNAEGLKAGWAFVNAQENYNSVSDPRTNPGTLGWSIATYDAMYKLTGDRKWLDEAMGVFNTHVSALWKRFGPHLYDAENIIRDSDYYPDDLNYCSVIGSLCELHDLTGDANVLKLLQEGCEKPFADSFYDAPLFLSDLFAYVALKTNNPSHLRRAASLFAQGFPESKCPPVFLPDDRTWSRTSAMTLRTGHLLQYGNWKGVEAPP